MPAKRSPALYFRVMCHDSGRAVLRAARHAAREADAPLLLAVSGGLDSMALLHAMSSVAHARIAAVATFDHGTGVAATAAVAHVARAAAALGLPVVTGRASGTVAPRGGREAAWRRARLAFLREAAAPLGARVATAHTEDDQVETVLMRVLRGSGARGLAGLRAPGDTVRPFLGLRRATLADFARERGIPWHEDPTNHSRDFLRNRVRLDLLPALRGADPTLEASLLDAARRAADWRADVDTFLDARLAGWYAGADSLTVPRSELAGYDGDSLSVLWMALAARLGLALDRRGTERLASFTFNEGRSRFVPLSGGWRVEAVRGSFVLRRQPERVAAAQLPEHGLLHWGRFRFRVTEASTETGDMGARSWSALLPANGDAVVRPWMAGDRLAPAGGQPRRRVTRYLSDARVHGLDRAGWPVVVAGDDVVWIPGVRRSDAATERSGRPVRRYVCERIDR